MLKMTVCGVKWLGSVVWLLVSAALHLLKHCLKLNSRVHCCCHNRVQGKVVIITGANSGIGYATAVDLAQKGARVYLGCRGQQAGQQAAATIRKKTGNAAVFFLHLDLTKFSSIHTFVQSFLKCEGQLHALVNNAGVFHHPSGLTDDGFNLTLQTNYLGPFLLSQLLVGVLQGGGGGGRLVLVSSEAYRLVGTQAVQDCEWRRPGPELSQPFSSHVHSYATSKLALHLLAQHLATTAPNLVVLLTDPGNVWTPIYRHSWQSWGEVLTRLRCYAFMRGPSEGAQPTIHALNAPQLSTNTYITCNLEVENTEPYDQSTVDQLIAQSCQLVGV